MTLGVKGVGSHSGVIETQNTRLGNKKDSVDFSGALKNAIQKVDKMQKDADKAATELIGGKTSVHNTMIAIEKANMSFELMLQMRNKLVSAYEEIMRQQV